MALGPHPFEHHPHRTLLALSLPVLISLIAEPLTGLVDTIFIARLGSGPLAALGIGATLISGIFWIFNFLGIGTQTEVAHASGSQDAERAREAPTQALVLALGIGALLALLVWPLAPALVAAMGAEADSLAGGTVYLRIRLLGGPAVLILLAAFGALRGLQDMRTPLLIALLTNALNIVGDAVLIFGFGPIPRLEMAGAAWASTGSQWIGAVLAVAAVARRPGLTRDVSWRSALRLLRVGRDLFLRTGALLGFLTLATAAANHAGTESGAAHQVVRQIWSFTAFGLDAFATAAQSLVGYFRAGSQIRQARRVAEVACAWGLATGVLLLAAMGASTPWIMQALVPLEARSVFVPAWWVCALFQPINALSFTTDGIHWGTGDYTYLRNSMWVAGIAGSVALWMLRDFDLLGVWIATGVFIAMRALLGMLRVWPGIGRSPLAPVASEPVLPSPP